MATNDQKPKFSLKDIVKLTEIYEQIHEGLIEKIESLEEIQQGFPVKVSKDIPYDNLVLTASNGKHKALSLLRGCVSAAGAVQIDYKFCQSFILLDKAEELLRDKGFDKMTDSLRQAAMASSEELREFAKVVIKVESLEETCRGLFKAFESDEVNFRKMFDKNDFKGF